MRIPDDLSASSKHNVKLRHGLKQSVTLQKSVLRQGTLLIERKAVNSSGPFRYAVIDDAPELHLFCQQLALSKLALFLLEAHRVRRQPRLPNPSEADSDALALAAQEKRQQKPFVLCAQNKLRGTYLVVGVPLAPHLGKVAKK